MAQAWGYIHLQPWRSAIPFRESNIIRQARNSFQDIRVSELLSKSMMMILENYITSFDPFSHRQKSKLKISLLGIAKEDFSRQAGNVSRYLQSAFEKSIDFQDMAPSSALAIAHAHKLYTSLSSLPDPLPAEARKSIAHTLMSELNAKALSTSRWPGVMARPLRRLLAGKWRAGRRSKHLLSGQSAYGFVTLIIISFSTVSEFSREKSTQERANIYWDE